MLLYFAIAFVSILFFLYFGIPKEERPSIFSLVGDIMSSKKTAHGFQLSALSLGSLVAGVAAIIVVFKTNQSSEEERKAKQPTTVVAPVSSEKEVAPTPSASSFRNEEGCTQLGEVAANAFTTKKEGHSLQSVLTELRKLQIPDPQRRQAAEGVVIAIYGDSAIRSRAEARNIAYSACKG